MGKRKTVFLGGAFFILLLASFLIYSEITAQVGFDDLTRGEFTDILVQVLGIDLPVGAGDWGDVSYLWKIKEPLENYAPADGWGVASDIITVEEMAYVFGQILDLPLPATSFLSQLQGLGLMQGANPDDNFTLEDLIDFINDLSDAVAEGGISLPAGMSISPYELPVSPTQ